MSIESWVVSIDENEDGDLVLPLPNELLAALGWETGDHLSWAIREDGTVVLSQS